MLLAGVSLVVGLSSLAGCSGYDTADLVEAYQRSHPEVSDAVAVCVVDHLVSATSVEEVVDQLSDQAEAGDDPAFELAQFQAEFACGLRDQTRSDLEDGLRAQGYDAEEASCAADQLVESLDLADLDALLAGNMPDEFYARYVTALEDCGAIS